jgi:glycosyltransferase involved in cell wall biosynthesis
VRLLFCCEFYHPSRGGVQEVMRQIAERLAPAGHEVTVATSYLPERDFTSHNGVAIRDFRIVGNAIVGMSGEIERYREFVFNFGADAVLIKAAQQWTFDALWPILGQINARKVFIPCGFSGLYEKAYAGYFAQLPDVLRRFDHLIFYAEKYRDIDFARAHGLTRYSILPNGASEREFEAPLDDTFRGGLGISEQEFVFLTVGTPIASKGHRQVVEAFARLRTKRRPVTLILNGEWPPPFRPKSALATASRRATAVIRLFVHALRGWDWGVLQAGTKAAIERSRSGRAIEDWIRDAKSQPDKKVLCTDMQRSDLVQAFMTADLFVFASIVEYSPLVLFEAAAAGTPFLSVPVGNAKEIADWTGGGMICRAEKDERGYTRVDPSVLAREMERCMDSPDMLARIGATGKERWRRLFTWQAIARQYESILMGGKGGETPPHFMGSEVRDSAPHEAE